MDLKRRKGRTLSTIDSKGILRLAHLLTEKSIPPTEFTWFKETMIFLSGSDLPNEKVNYSMFGEALIESHRILEEAGLSELGRIVVRYWPLKNNLKKRACPKY